MSDARDRYVPKVTVSNDPSVNYFTVGITRGVFDVYIYEIMSNDYGQTWPELRGSFVLGNFGGNKTNQVKAEVHYYISKDAYYNIMNKMLYLTAIEFNLI